MMPDPKPEQSEILRDLQYMTARWPELTEPALLEVRLFAEGKKPMVLRYAPDALDMAADDIARWNATGRNAYVVRNPIRVGAPAKGATDADILASFFLWADCDDREAASNVKRFDGPKYHAAVTTGRTPDTRVHIYWELNAPQTDMAAWRDMQTRIAAHFKSDPSVINPSRIMRIGGTVSWPDSKKQTKGYIDELVTIRTQYDDPRPRVSFDQMARVFGSQTLSQQAQAASGLQIDTGALPTLDRERARIQAMSGIEWHNNMVKYVASSVAKGLSDDEIHALTDVLTTPGYTVDQTRREVQTAIDGARRKGWTPEPEHTPNFDHSPAPTASDPTPQAKSWTVQSADVFTADFIAPEYILDGVIQRGRLYTLTAPTGSGKTGVMLYLAASISSGEDVAGREVEQGSVLFLAGENPDDVRARVIATMETTGIRPENMHFIPGTFSIRADMERLATEAAKLPNLVLIVVDTFAAYFDGDDENSNAQALDFARVIRRLTMLPSKPAVIMPAHPVKNAGKGNLSPKGGSSLVNEVDGNLTLWKEGSVTTLHWQVKIRGPEFDPLPFELERFESDTIRDSKGRNMPTVLAKPLLLSRAMELSQENMTLEDRVLLTVDNDPALSLDGRGVMCGGVHKQKIKRTLEKLERQKLVRRFRTNWELTKDGERAVEMIRDGAGFAPEIE